jgi:hypothetical protein
MEFIRVQSPTGDEHNFSTREEFARAAIARVVRDDWQIYHRVSHCWVPVTAHPAFREAQTARLPRSPDLVLIYPDGSIHIRKSGPQDQPEDAPSREIELTAAELSRVANMRWSGESPAIPDVAHGAGARQRRSSPLLRALPTFARALLILSALFWPRH